MSDQNSQKSIDPSTSPALQGLTATSDNLSRSPNYRSRSPNYRSRSPLRLSCSPPNRSRSSSESPSSRPTPIMTRGRGLRMGRGRSRGPYGFRGRCMPKFMGRDHFGLRGGYRATGHNKSKSS